MFQKVPKIKTVLIRRDEAEDLAENLLLRENDLQNKGCDIIDVKISCSVGITDDNLYTTYIGLIIYRDPKDIYKKVIK